MTEDHLDVLWSDVRAPLIRFGDDGERADRILVSIAALRALAQLHADPDGCVVPDELAERCGRGPANVRRELDLLVRRGYLRRDRQLGYFLGEADDLRDEIHDLFSRLDADAEFRLAATSLALQREVVGLIEELETRKVTQQAKRVLMRTRGMSEEEAHSFLLKRSRDRNLPLRELAETIIAAASSGPNVVSMRPPGFKRNA